MKFEIFPASVMLVLSIGDICIAQENFLPPAQPEVYSSVRTFNSVQIDGLLSESDWESAPVISEFIQKNPDQGSLASYPTEVKVMYDSDWLYIGVVCYQPESELIVENLERDFNYFQNDLFGVAIDGFQDKRNAIAFQVTPLGSLRDLQIIDGSNDNEDWNAVWDAKTTISDEYWIAEIAIPWTIIRYEEGADQLGVIFARNIRSQNEFSSAPAVPRSMTVYRMEYGGLLTGLETPPPSTNIQVNPYLLGDLQRVDTNGDNNSEFVPKIGGDVKWALNTNSVLDLTFNTDFAQVEADVQVVNLNRFSVYFPEKRQFFLENSDLFNPSITSWIQPFFSRRIGLSNTGAPIPIDAGSRFVNQSSKYRLGALAIRQREAGGFPASNFGVFRYSRNLSDQSRLGGMLTYRNDESLSAKSAQNNFTYTIDGLHRFNQSFRIQGMLSGSYDEITKNGLGGQLLLAYDSNLMYVGLLEYYNRNYNPGMGLEILNNNYIMTSPAISFDFRPDWLPSFLRSYNPSVYGYFFHGSDTGDFLFGYAGVRPIVFGFESGASFRVTIEPNWQVLEAPFFPVGIEVSSGDYQYMRYYVYAATNPASKISGSVSTSFGGYYDGELERYTLSGRLAPVPRIEFTGSYQITKIQNLGISSQNNETHLIRFGPKFALNPRLLFSGLYQWNNSSNQHLWNMRISWEFLPLSYAYLVVNSSLIDENDPLQRVNQQQYITKVSYVHQF